MDNGTVAAMAEKGGRMGRSHELRALRFALGHCRGPTLEPRRSARPWAAPFADRRNFAPVRRRHSRGVAIDGAGSDSGREILRGMARLFSVGEEHIHPNLVSYRLLHAIAGRQDILSSDADDRVQKRRFFSDREFAIERLLGTNYSAFSIRSPKHPVTLFDCFRQTRGRARLAQPTLGQGQGSKLPKATRITHAARKVSQNRRTSSSGLW
jgi:hypothetical protein